ncbi:MAG TPA: aldo/keto reductase [Polyangiaceae bacterium]|nr:aldo/keto reductase [Polyangiaceae bacterium]
MPEAPPPLALGAMNFGKRTDAKESERIVRRALERGITVFDTANSYNGGESERLLGRALGADRERVIVSTKAGIGLDPTRREGLSRQTLESALKASLDRLGTNRVDIYYLHLPDRKTPIEKTLDGVAELVESGRVIAWGASNYASWELLEMRALAEGRGLAPPVITQLLYNVLHRQLEVEYFAFARRYPIHTTAYNALAGGLLSGKHSFDASAEKGSRFDDNPMYRRRYWSREMFARVEQVAQVARDEGCTPVQLAYAWLAAQPDVDSILVGPGTVEHLDDAIDGVERTLSPDAAGKLDALARDWSGSDTNYVR